MKTAARMTITYDAVQYRRDDGSIAWDATRLTVKRGRSVSEVIGTYPYGYVALSRCFADMKLMRGEHPTAQIELIPEPLR